MSEKRLDAYGIIVLLVVGAILMVNGIVNRLAPEVWSGSVLVVGAGLIGLIRLIIEAKRLWSCRGRRGKRRTRV